jgi:hypothetical protein
MRLESVDRIFYEFNRALDFHFETHPERGSRSNPGPEFVPPPLGEGAFEALVWIRDHDSDKLVRQHAQDVIELYHRFGGAAFLSGVKAMPDAQNVIDAAKAFQRLGQVLPPQTERFANSQINPFKDPSAVLPLKNKDRWRLATEDVSAHFRLPRKFETDEQWLDYIAGLTRIANLSDSLKIESRRPQLPGVMVAANDNYAAPDLAALEAQAGSPILRDGVIEFLREVAHFHPSAQVRLGAIVAAVVIAP